MIGRWRDYILVLLLSYTCRRCNVYSCRYYVILHYGIIVHLIPTHHSIVRTIHHHIRLFHIVADWSSIHHHIRLSHIITTWSNIDYYIRLSSWLITDYIRLSGLVSID